MYPFTPVTVTYLQSLLIEPKMAFKEMTENAIKRKLQESRKQLNPILPNLNTVFHVEILNNRLKMFQ